MTSDDPGVPGQQPPYGISPQQPPYGGQEPPTYFPPPRQEQPGQEQPGYFPSQQQPYGQQQEPQHFPPPPGLASRHQYRQPQQYGDELDNYERELIRKHRESKAHPDPASLPNAGWTPTVQVGGQAADGSAAPAPAPAHASPGSAHAWLTKKFLIIAGIVVVLAIGGIIAGLMLTGSRGGFYDMNTLQQSVQSQVDNREPGAVVESCSMASGNTALCEVTDNGDNQGVTITISADGQSWVSN